MEEVEIPQQRVFSGARFPLILSPSGASGSFIDAVKAHNTLLESRLLQADAILFHGFPVNTASDFNDVVEVFGFEDLPYIGGAAPRTNVVDRVFTANESPPDQKIPYHHEMAQLKMKKDSTLPSRLYLQQQNSGMMILGAIFLFNLRNFKGIKLNSIIQDLHFLLIIPISYLQVPQRLYALDELKLNGIMLQIDKFLVVDLDPCLP